LFTLQSYHPVPGGRLARIIRRPLLFELEPPPDPTLKLGVAPVGGAPAGGAAKDPTGAVGAGLPKPNPPGAAAGAAGGGFPKGAVVGVVPKVGPGC